MRCHLNETWGNWDESSRSPMTRRADPVGALNCKKECEITQLVNREASEGILLMRCVGGVGMDPIKSTAMS